VIDALRAQLGRPRGLGPELDDPLGFVSAVVFPPFVCVAARVAFVVGTTSMVVVTGVVGTRVPCTGSGVPTRHPCEQRRDQGDGEWY